MSLSQYPWAGNLRRPIDWGALIYYGNPTWNHPTMGSIPKPKNITSYDWFIIHYGGGPNPGGDLDPDETPGMTWRDKLKATIGVVRSVLKSWEKYHIYSKGWRGIAYSAAVGQFGRLFGLRGTVQNGAQYGSEWNNYSIAVVCVLGGNQKPRRWMRRRLARMLLEFPPKKGVLGHQQTGYNTECPGPNLLAWINDHGWIKELGIQGVGARNRTVGILRKRLHREGYFAFGKGLEYTPAVAAAVRAYQRDNGLKQDGVAGPDTFRSLIEKGWK